MGEISKKLGLRIKELREQKGLTQFKLAEMLNMEASNLSKIERGIQLPKEESLLKLSEALNISVSDLFAYEHFTDRNALIKNIENILNESELEKLQRIYKIIINM